MRVGDVSVDLSGRDISMAEHLLDGADICSVLNKMRGKGVAKRVRRDAFEAAFFGVFFYKSVNLLTVQEPARRRYEQVRNLDIFVLSAKGQVAL